MKQRPPPGGGGLGMIQGGQGIGGEGPPVGLVPWGPGDTGEGAGVEPPGGLTSEV